MNSGRRDRHVMEALGMTQVVIEDGEVVEVGDPRIRYCPLFFKYRGIESLTPEQVRENVEFRIADFGLCTPGRKLRMRDYLSFGISEILAMCVEEAILDCGVIVCDGAGTVVISDPEVIQGIGGRISGLVETSPIPEIIGSIGPERVLDAGDATIDQVEGARLARSLEMSRIGVTVAYPDDASKLRELLGNDVVLFAVHTTGISMEGAESMFDTCDIITSCASRSIREVAERRAIFSVGSKIPIYAATEPGAVIMRRRLERVGKARNKENAENPDPPDPLI